MNYPVWELPMGGGVLIAVVSILHVFISHFAVGGGLWLVVTEMRAHATGDETLRTFVKQHSRFFILVTLVFGAISGVGIWVTIALVSPESVSALVHAYVWGWAMEWVFFALEIAAALVYYYGWDRLPRGLHVTVGWIYFVAAWASLVIINGIITFMLTPGGWLENHEFWTGFFNPTYWPSVFIRTFGAVAIAGMFTLLTASLLPRDGFRWRQTRWNAAIVVLSLIGVALCARWYAGNVDIWQENEALLGAIPVLPQVAWLFKLGLLVTLVLAVVPLLVPKVSNGFLVGLLLLSGLGTMGAGEWLREAGRKPFTIHQYMYSTGMRTDQEDWFAEHGMAAGTKWLSPAAATDELALGRDLYRAWCQSCHTWDGYNGLGAFVDHWNEETVASLVPRLEYMRALMPPWFGTEDENAALTAYLLSRQSGAPPPLPSDRQAARQQAFDLACGLCHTPHGYRSLADSFEDMDAEEIGEFLDESGDMTDEMPGYLAPDPYRELLIEYLQQLGAASVAAAESSEGSDS